MKTKIILSIIMLFFGANLLFAQQNKKSVSTKKDTSLRHDHLRIDYNLLITSYNSVIRDYNKYINSDAVTGAKVLSDDLSKIDIILSNEDSLTAKEAVWLTNQNINDLTTSIGTSVKTKIYSLSIAQSDQLIASNKMTIQKINLYLKNSNDNDAFNAWTAACENTITLFQKFIKN